MALTQVDQGLLSSTAQYTGFKNRIINGAMVIDQRSNGASVTINTSPIYTIDRWYCGKSGTGNNFTAQRSTTAPTGFTNSLLITAGTGVTPASGNFMFLSQAIEGFNFADLNWGATAASAGQTAATVTLSFWVRSSLTGTFGVGLRNGAADRSYIASYTINAANTWEQKTVTIAGDTSGTWATDNTQACGVFFDLGNGSTFSSTAGSWSSANLLGGLTGGVKLTATTGATLNITGVQLEKGSTATSFDYRPYTTELLLCQRYYFKLLANSIYTAFGSGVYDSTTTAACYIKYPVSMRSSPTITQSNTATYETGTRPTTGIGGAYNGRDSAFVSLSRTTSSSAGFGCIWIANVNADAFVEGAIEL